MGTVRKTITLTDQQDNWVKAQINAGHYTNDSEKNRGQTPVSALFAVWRQCACSQSENSATVKMGI